MMFVRKKKSKGNKGESFGLKLGTKVRSELLSFISVFAPEGERGSADAEVARAMSFELLHPKDSLDGFHSYLQIRLREAFPKSGKGEAIFQAYRPAYGPAFEKAVAWRFCSNQDGSGDDAAAAAAAAASGEGRGGGGGATIANLEQFRVLHAWVCVYAAAYDAFHVVARDPDPAARLGVEAWSARSSKVLAYGFEGFARVAELQRSRYSSKMSLVQSSAFFSDALDNSEDQKVDWGLGEWFDYVVRSEVAARTALGACLSEEPRDPTRRDEAGSDNAGRAALSESDLAAAEEAEEQERRRRAEEDEERKRQKITLIALRKQRAAEVRAAARRKRDAELAEEARRTREEAEAAEAARREEEERRKREEEEAKARLERRWQARAHRFLEGDSWTVPICCLVLVSTVLTQYIIMKGGIELLEEKELLDDFFATNATATDEAGAGAAEWGLLVPDQEKYGGEDGLVEEEEEEEEEVMVEEEPPEWAAYDDICSETCACACSPTVAPTVTPTIGGDILLAAKLVVLISIFFFFEVTTRLYCWRVVQGTLSTFFVKDLPKEGDQKRDIGDDHQGAATAEGNEEGSGVVDENGKPLPTSRLARVQWLNVIDVVVVGSDVFFFVMTIISDAGPCSFVLGRFARLLRLFKCGKGLKMLKMVKAQTALSKVKKSKLAKRASISMPPVDGGKLEASANSAKAKQRPASLQAGVAGGGRGGFQRLPTSDPDYNDNGNDDNDGDANFASSSTGRAEETADRRQLRRRRRYEKQRQRLHSVLNEATVLLAASSSSSVTSLESGSSSSLTGWQERVMTHRRVIVCVPLFSSSSSCGSSSSSSSSSSGDFGDKRDDDDDDDDDDADNLVADVAVLLGRLDFVRQVPTAVVVVVEAAEAPPPPPPPLPLPPPPPEEAVRLVAAFEVQVVDGERLRDAPRDRPTNSPMLGHSISNANPLSIDAIDEAVTSPAVSRQNSYIVAAGSRGGGGGGRGGGRGRGRGRGGGGSFNDNDREVASSQRITERLLERHIADENADVERGLYAGDVLGLGDMENGV